MAKLKAPLLSLGAAGAIGKSLVFFGWKGLDVVREYVIPSNPKTAAQTTQRGYLADAVAAIHAAQASAANPLDEDDASAYSLLASLRPTPSTWFNAICRQWLKQKVAGLIPSIFRNMSAVGGATKLTVTGNQTPESDVMTDGKLHYGTSKSALINSIDCTIPELSAGKEISGLTAGVKYFVQYRPDTPVDFIGSNSGIYYGVPTA